MTSIKLTRVFIGIQETKFGDKEKVAVKCEQLGEEWLSTFKVTDRMRQWKEGDIVEVNITKKKSADGQKTFYNFEEGIILGAELSSKPVQPQEKVIQLEEEEDIFKF